MRRMDKVFLSLILVGGFWETEAISVTGELGGDVTINCSHTNAKNNIKYFCKEPCKDKDVLIRSNEKRKSKYSIKDKGNTFSVKISHLREDDAGTYYCGIARSAFDTFNKVVLTVTKGRTHDPDGDFSQSTIGEAFTTNAAHLAFTTNASGPIKSVSADMVLYATVGSIATLSVSLLLATRFRKRRDVISADEGEFDNENDDIEKEVWSMKRLSEKNSGAHHPKLDPSTSVYTEVKYSAPLHISENICSRGATESRHSAANVLSTMISQRAGAGCLRKDTDAPAALRNAMIKVTDSCLSTVSVVYYRTCSDSTESGPRSLWFGFNLSE